MTLKDIWSRITDWFRAEKMTKPFRPAVNHRGLISQALDDPRPVSNEVAVQPAAGNASVEKLQEGFNRLIDQLEGINEHLGRQADRHEALMQHLEKLPAMIESFPAMVENQKQLIEQTLEQLKVNALRNRQFLEIIEKIPAETARQTDALGSIDNQLAAAAAVDAQLSENFHKFSETLGKLSENTAGQSDSIMQMSKTFTASDRYLKYMMNVQNKRFMWLFAAAISVCAVAIIILTAVIIYITQ